jgi:hypothetical protein
VNEILSDPSALAFQAFTQQMVSEYLSSVMHCGQIGLNQKTSINNMELLSKALGSPQCEELKVSYLRL